jgi:hypothetical protein
MYFFQSQLTRRGTVIKNIMRETERRIEAIRGWSCKNSTKRTRRMIAVKIPITVGVGDVLDFFTMLLLAPLKFV